MRWSRRRQGKISEALRLMEQAIERDPRYGPALAWAAFYSVWLLREDRSEDREADRLKGADFASRALEVAGGDAGVLANAALELDVYFNSILSVRLFSSPTRSISCDMRRRKSSRCCSGRSLRVFGLRRRVQTRPHRPLEVGNKSESGPAPNRSSKSSIRTAIGEPKDSTGTKRARGGSKQCSAADT